MHSCYCNGDVCGCDGLFLQVACGCNMGWGALPCGSLQCSWDSSVQSMLGFAAVGSGCKLVTLYGCRIGGQHKDLSQCISHGWGIPFLFV